VSGLQIGGETISSYRAHGWTLAADYRYSRPEQHWQLGATIGSKWWQTSGQTQNDRYEARSVRLMLGISGHYQLLNRWTTGLGLQLENNRDFEGFRILTNDNFRSNLVWHNEFPLISNIVFTIDVVTVLQPRVDAWLLSNPPQQLLVGLKYNWL
ncbi:MAG: hypothetical protein AAFO94_23030, partial [Bacteroidota bacterium]